MRIHLKDLIITKKFIFIVFGILFFSCHKEGKSDSVSQKVKEKKWNFEELNKKAIQHLDSTKWDLELFKQDIDTYKIYSEVFQSYPLNKSPFPVAKYDYAVSSIPFLIKVESRIFKGIRIGEYENPESEKIIDKLTLLVLTNDKNAEESTLVDSRNYPYLTAQGVFKVINNEFDWIFTYSPDGYSTLLLNMKLFDLRFGETVIIYPQTDKSFLYEQIKDSPNNYENFKDFTKSIIENPKVKNQLISHKNIK